MVNIVREDVFNQDHPKLKCSNKIFKSYLEAKFWTFQTQHLDLESKHSRSNIQNIWKRSETWHRERAHQARLHFDFTFEQKIAGLFCRLFPESVDLARGNRRTQFWFVKKCVVLLGVARCCSVFRVSSLRKVAGVPPAKIIANFWVGYCLYWSRAVCGKEFVIISTRELRAGSWYNLLKFPGTISTRGKF